MNAENDGIPLPEPDNSDFGDGIEGEDSSSGERILKPWNPAKIRITTKNFSLREIVEQIKEGEIDLAPDFQRDYVWKKRQRTRLIESILIGIPLPAFYFNQETEGTYQVADGVQRLSTIRLFMSDGHVLEAEDLEYLTDLKDQKYSMLEPAMVRRLRVTQIVVHVIEPQTPDEVKYDIFGRVNTLGSPLSAQEIRHAMSKLRSRDFLKSLIELPSFDAATEHHFRKKSGGEPGKSVRDSKRMANRELALRFCAFSRYSEAEYRKHESLDAFLLDFTRRIDGGTDNPLSDQDLDTLRERFDGAMNNAFEVLGEAAFRRWPPGEKQQRGPINRAVYESQSIALADYPLDRLRAHKDEIVAAFRKTFKNNNYTKSVTAGTGDPVRTSFRLNHTRKILKEILR